VIYNKEEIKLISVSNINERSKKANWKLVSKAEEKRLVKSLHVFLKKKGLYADIHSNR